MWNGNDAGWLGLFFFSSRRRHTRFDCDWSSDVCSSDLVGTLDINSMPSEAIQDQNSCSNDSQMPDRKSTRLNSSHSQISYAVFCLKKKKKTEKTPHHVEAGTGEITHTLREDDRSPSRRD